MNWSDITIENISNFIEGNVQRLKDHLRLLAPYEKEQVLYRATQCPKDCSINGKCHYCKCDYPEKLYVKHSCNKGKSLPKLMNEVEWEEYKKKLKIDNKK